MDLVRQAREHISKANTHKNQQTQKQIRTHKQHRLHLLRSIRKIAIKLELIQPTFLAHMWDRT